MQLKKDIRIVKRPNKTLIFSIKEGVLFEINKTGERIFNLLKNKKTKTQIYKEMCKQFPKKSKTKIKKDADMFLKKLCQSHFLQK